MTWLSVATAAEVLDDLIGVGRQVKRPHLA
jgi:hypothetical protein